MIALSLEKVDGFVARLQRKGINVKWEGWTMVFLRPHKHARTSQDGRYQNGEWGFEQRVEPNSQGQWLVNHRLVKGTNA
jgi:hypothetical protein